MNGYNRHVRAAASYRDALRTQTPARQVVQLYDMAILRLKEAKAAILEQRIEDRHHAVMKAFAIMSGLQSCLDFERGGTVAPMLDGFYNHATARMLHINRHNDPKICDELVSYLEPMRASWAQLADGTPPSAPVDAGSPLATRPASLVT
jgi:flagellar protein FliS